MTTQHPRSIMHLDMGAYFAAAAQCDDRDRRGRRVGVVGTQPRGLGVVALLDRGVEVK